MAYVPEQHPAPSPAMPVDDLAENPGEIRAGLLIFRRVVRDGVPRYIAPARRGEQHPYQIRVSSTDPVRWALVHDRHGPTGRRYRYPRDAALAAQRREQAFAVAVDIDELDARWAADVADDMAADRRVRAAVRQLAAELTELADGPHDERSITDPDTVTRVTLVADSIVRLRDHVAAAEARIRDEP